MDLGNILKKAGSAVISSVVPGGGLIVDLINEFLPSDNKLPKTATGAEAQAAIDGLTPELRLQLMTRELDVDIAEVNAWSNVQESLAKADESGKSTRPRIALMFARQIVFTCNVVSFAVAYSIVTGDKSVIEVINQIWPIMLAFIGPMITVIYQYYGKRTKEKVERYNLAMGQIKPTLVDSLKTIISK